MTPREPPPIVENVTGPKAAATAPPAKPKAKAKPVQNVPLEPPAKGARRKLSDEAKRALWPASKVELVPVSSLILYAQNARTHSPKQLRQIAGLMRKFGWTNAVLRDEKNIIWAGNGRIQAAPLLIEAGLTEFSMAPVINATGWTEAQKKAYALADNQVALGAGWDPKLLESELKEISGMGFQMELLGFSASDLRRHLGTSAGGGLTDPDAAPEPPKVSVSRLGDLWLLGRHRILCGDSTSKAGVSRLFDGAKAALMATDPPYGVQYDPGWRDAAPLAKMGKRSAGKVQNDGRSDWREAWALFPGAVAYVWHAGKFCSSVEESLKAVGFEIRSQIIWRKPHFVVGRGDYHWQHEPCWYAVRKGATAKWRGGRKQSTVWDIANASAMGGKRDSEQSGHGTQKPVECMLRPIENNSVEGDIVYDPFLGSGTTVIAAEQSGRCCFGVELDPAYVDVAVRRWEAFTGQKALLSGRELSFEEMDAERKHGTARTKTNAHKPARAGRQSGRPGAAAKRAEAG